MNYYSFSINQEYIVVFIALRGVYCIRVVLANIALNPLKTSLKSHTCESKDNTN